MKSFQKYIGEYRKQLEKGSIQKAYQGLMKYMMSLKTHFKKKYPEYSISGSIYQGYMDMTYFPIFPESLKAKHLKIAIVFVHEKFRFEVWLSGKNKQVLTKYWKLFSESDWDKYQIVSPVKGTDSIVEHILSDNPDFSDLDSLTKKIEIGTLNFIKDVDSFLSET